MRPPDAFAELERIDSEIELMMPEIERITNDPSASQEEVDRVGEALGTAIGRYRMLCACHSQLEITEDCVSLEQGISEWIE